MAIKTISVTNAAPVGSLVGRRAVVFTLLAGAASANTANAASITPEIITSDLAPKHPWLSSQTTHIGAATYFTNLKSEENVQSPFLVKFGLSDWNLAPSKVNLPRTGHHLLLIDTPLPERPNSPVIGDKRHIHYSLGQMEAVLNLPPGRHTLRLLLANYLNVPYFIYSPELVVNVREGLSDLPTNTGKVRSVELLNLPEDGKVRAPFKLQFHASGLNVANARSRTSSTGHFVVTFTRAGSTETIAFKNGATEDWFSPPPGEYQVELRLVNNGNKPDTLARFTTTLNVVAE